MQAVKINQPTGTPVLSIKYISIAIILTILIVVALSVTKIAELSQPASLPSGTVVISKSTLEEKYGLRVNLVAVTAAGGFVDVRLKVVDGDKLKLLLADKKNFPTLYTKHGLTLEAPADTKSQPIDFASGGNLFILYPNSANAIRSNEQVSIVFGNLALEPISVK